MDLKGFFIIEQVNNQYTLSFESSDSGLGLFVSWRETCDSSSVSLLVMSFFKVLVYT